MEVGNLDPKDGLVVLTVEKPGAETFTAIYSLPRVYAMFAEIVRHHVSIGNDPDGELARRASIAGARAMLDGGSTDAQVRLHASGAIMWHAVSDPGGRGDAVRRRMSSDIRSTGVSHMIARWNDAEGIRVFFGNRLWPEDIREDFSAPTGVLH